MKVYAVIDTNVLVSALFTKHPDTAPAQILERLFDRGRTSRKTQIKSNKVIV